MNNKVRVVAPQGLKPAFELDLDGSAEAEPFQDQFYVMASEC